MGNNNSALSRNDHWWGEVDRYIVIHPRTTAFEFRNIEDLFVAISRAKSAGKIFLIPICMTSLLLGKYMQNMPQSKNTTTAYRENEIQRIETKASRTYNICNYLMQDIKLWNLQHNLNFPNISEGYLCILFFHCFSFFFIVKKSLQGTVGDILVFNYLMYIFCSCSYFDK